MTKLLEEALQTVRLLPVESQDEIARAMLPLAGRQSEPFPWRLKNACHRALKGRRRARRIRQRGPNTRPLGQARLVRLLYTSPALTDLDQILDYVVARSPQGALNVQTRIRAVIDLLLQYPSSARRLPIQAFAA
jgi:hypothetical protein